MGRIMTISVSHINAHGTDILAITIWMYPLFLRASYYVQLHIIRQKWFNPLFPGSHFSNGTDML